MPEQGTWGLKPEHVEQLARGYNKGFSLGEAVLAEAAPDERERLIRVLATKLANGVAEAIVAIGGLFEEVGDWVGAVVRRATELRLPSHPLRDVERDGHA